MCVYGGCLGGARQYDTCTGRWIRDKNRMMQIGSFAGFFNQSRAMQVPWSYQPHVIAAYPNLVDSFESNDGAKKRRHAFQLQLH